MGRMYVSVGNADMILRFDGAATGDARPQARLMGISPHGPTFLAIDVPHDRIAAVSNNFNNVVILLDNVSTTGFPPRILSGAATGFHFPAFCALDSARDLLYVTDDTSILVFSPASTINGNVAPVRTMTLGFSPGGFVYDATNDRLFLSDAVNNAVSVFDALSILSGPVTPNRVITGAATQLNVPGTLALDGAGHLIVHAGSPTVVITSLLVFSNAGSASGNIAPSASATIDRFPAQMAVSSAGELYMADGGTEVPVYSNVANASGMISPVRIISGPDTGLNFPMPGVPPLTVGIALDPTR